MKTQHQSRCSQPFAFWDRLTVHMVFIMFNGNHDKNNYAAKPIIARKNGRYDYTGGNSDLEDETTVINQEIALIGRADRGGRNAKRKWIFPVL